MLPINFASTTPTCPKCAYKISQIFSRVIEFALAEKPRNPRKLMYREYFHVYSTTKLSFMWKQKILGLSPWSSLVFLHFMYLWFTDFKVTLNYLLHKFLTNHYRIRVQYPTHTKAYFQEGRNLNTYMYIYNQSILTCKLIYWI